MYTLYKILECFNINSKIYNGLIINKDILNKKQVIFNIKNIYNLLEKKYRKSVLDKLYNDLSFINCITILRHNLKLQNYKLISNKNQYILLDIDYIKNKNKVTITFD